MSRFVLVSTVAASLIVGCASAAAPTATALLPGSSNPPLAAMSPASIAHASTALLVRRTTTGSPDRNLLTSVICGHPPLELASQVNALVDEGGAVRFDKGVVVMGDASALANPLGVVGVRSPNGLAAFVCVSDLERARR